MAKRMLGGRERLCVCVSAVKERKKEENKTKQNIMMIKRFYLEINKNLQQVRNKKIQSHVKICNIKKSFVESTPSR